MIIPKPGDRWVITSARSGTLTVTVLAVKGNMVLGEHQDAAPKLTTQLVMIDLKNPALSSGKPVSYRALGKDWLKRIVDGGQVWIGNPRRHVYMPSAADMLKMKGGR